MTRFFTLLCFFLSFSSSLLAQDSLAVKDTIAIPQKNKYNFKQLIHESGKFVIQPIKWNGYDWIKVGVIGGITYLVMQQDETIRTTALDNPVYSKSVPME